MMKLERVVDVAGREDAVRRERWAWGCASKLQSTPSSDWEI
jgi:hypothetical protein